MYFFVVLCLVSAAAALPAPKEELTKLEAISPKPELSKEIKYGFEIDENGNPIYDPLPDPIPVDNDVEDKNDKEFKDSEDINSKKPEENFKDENKIEDSQKSKRSYDYEGGRKIKVYFVKESDFDIDEPQGPVSVEFEEYPRFSITSLLPFPLNLLSFILPFRAGQPYYVVAEEDNYSY